MNTVNIESINAELKNLWSEYNEITDNAKNELQSLLTKWLGNDIKALSLGETRFSFGFASDTWENGEPRYTEIEIYHGYDYDDNLYRFELNPFTGGSFSIIASENDTNNDIRLRHYFEINGKILSDVNNATKLKNILKQYCDDVKPITKHRYELNYKAREIERTEREAKNAAEETKKQNELLEKFNNTKFGYALIKKVATEHSNYIYRKAPVQLIDIFTDEVDAYRELRNYNRNNCYGIKYALVDIAKVKKA